MMLTLLDSHRKHMYSSSRNIHVGSNTLLRITDLRKLNIQAPIRYNMILLNEIVLCYSEDDIPTTESEIALDTSIKNFEYFVFPPPMKTNNKTISLKAYSA